MHLLRGILTELYNYQETMQTADPKCGPLFGPQPLVAKMLGGEACNTQLPIVWVAVFVSLYLSLLSIPPQLDVHSYTVCHHDHPHHDPDRPLHHTVEHLVPFSTPR